MSLKTSMHFLIFCFLVIFSGVYGKQDKLIIPKPQQVQFYEGVLKIEQIPSIQKYYDGEEPLNIATREMESIFSRFDGCSEESDVTIILADISSRAWKEADISLNISFPEKAQGYTLVVREGEIIVLGTDPHGLFYSLQTLKQLIFYQDSSFVLPLIKIQDYPLLEFRGIHFFTGRKALREQKQLIDFMSFHKMNYAVMQIDYLEFENFPEIRYEPYAQSREEVKELVEYAHDRYIKIIPLLPSYGHAEWAFRTGHLMDIAEQLEDPMAFRVNYPRTYEVLFKMYDEVLELFETEWFHIGFDEVDHPDLGKYPYREETKAFSLEELIEMHLEKLAGYLGEKGIEKILLWGDMFLSREDAPTTSPAAASAPSLDIARKRRNILVNLVQKENSPDIIICDWHYQPNPPEKFTSLRAWHDTGLKTVASTWHNPINVRNFAHQAIEENSFGLLQTTWAGFNFSMVNNERNHHQFVSYLLAADYGWSGRDEMPAELPYDYSRQFWTRWDAQLHEADGTIKPESITREEQRRLFEGTLDSTLKLVIPEKFDDIQSLSYKWEYSLKNPFDREILITVSSDLLAEEEKYTLQPLESISKKTINVSIPLDEVSSSSTMKAEFTLSLKDKEDLEMVKEEYLPLLWVARRLNKAPEVNADLEDWKEVAPYVLDDDKFVSHKSQWNREDLSANLYLGHYEQKLYLAFKVLDNKHYNSDEPPTLWRGDAIQLAFDFMYDRTPYYNESDIEIGFALNNEGEIMRHSWFPHQDALTGIISKTEVAIVRDTPYTIYEIMVPLNILSWPDVEQRRVFGFTFSINDNDGEGFDGGIIGSQGIWDSKDPSLFGVLVLE